jgi:hypothetical protein
LKLSDHRMISVTFSDVSMPEVTRNVSNRNPKYRINWDSYSTYSEQSILNWFQNDE